VSWCLVMGGESVTARASEGRRAREGVAVTWRSAGSGVGTGAPSVRRQLSVGGEG
jgi:hypothetical protein